MQAIQNPGNKSGQRIVYAILQAATRSKRRESQLRLQWMPGHCENPGNDAADRLAKEAAQPGKTHPFRPLLTREKAFIRDNIHAQWEQEWKSSTKGGHLRKIDSTLPATLHEKALWDPAEEPGVSADTATHGTQLVIHLRKDIRLSRRRSCAHAARKKQSPTCWWTVQI